VSGDPEYAIGKKDLERFVEGLNKTFDQSSSLKSIFLRIQHASKGVETNFFEIHLSGTDHIRETLKVNKENFSFHISPTAFFQPNTRQAEKLYAKAIDLAKITKETVLYDLYCGTGTIGIIAAGLAKQVVGVEISPESVMDAKTNVEINGIDNITFVTGAVRNVLTQIKEIGNLPHPDIVVVDPPRPGLDAEVIRTLIEMAPEKIVYISCNPATQVENLPPLLDSGYKIMAIAPIDQFAHTPHVENIVLLQKC